MAALHQIVTLLHGQKLTGAEPVPTTNALGVVNGNQVLAQPEQCEMIKQHIRTFQSPYTDLREPIRQIEHIFLTEYAGDLIGNQCMDFMKQDGITEIEEAIMANTVERRLNDLLLRDEAAGIVVVNRQPIYVSCVSNFTNFLDLSRKTLRSLEVGIPCLILGRSNTSQHSYRWAQLLVQMCGECGIDPGMVTFLSCDLRSIQDITSSCQEHTGNLYTTCSRQLAAKIKETYPKVVASTGGPNTLVATELNDKVKQAIRMSAAIESSGQCTALRHCVVPSTTPDSDLASIFDSIPQIPDAPYAVMNNMFDGVFPNHQGSPAPTDYQSHGRVDAYFKIASQFPESGKIEEYWRKVVVDFSKVDTQVKAGEERWKSLAVWLNENQPISLAVNGPRGPAMELLLKLFDATGMVVYTVGSTDDADMLPAMTCQARPQNTEVFGEFPPRQELATYTKFPVIVPSSNPSYDASYSVSYLEKQTIDEYAVSSVKALLNQVKDKAILGYCNILIRYLQNVSKRNPKEGYNPNRTVLWGLQRPPLDSVTLIHCSAQTIWDDVAPIFILFYATTARDQVELVIDPANKALIELCQKRKLRHTVGSIDTSSKVVFNSIQAQPLKEFPMVGNFVSLYFPMGHIKVSTKPCSLLARHLRASMSRST